MICIRVVSSVNAEAATNDRVREDLKVRRGVFDGEVAKHAVDNEVPDYVVFVIEVIYKIVPVSVGVEEVESCTK